MTKRTTRAAKPRAGQRAPRRRAARLADVQAAQRKHAERLEQAARPLRQRKCERRLVRRRVARRRHCRVAAEHQEARDVVPRVLDACIKDVEAVQRARALARDRRRVPGAARIIRLE